MTNWGVGKVQHRCTINWNYNAAAMFSPHNSDLDFMCTELALVKVYYILHFAQQDFPRSYKPLYSTGPLVKNLGLFVLLLFRSVQICAFKSMYLCQVSNKEWKIWCVCVKHACTFVFISESKAATLMNLSDKTCQKKSTGQEWQAGKKRKCWVTYENLMHHDLCYNWFPLYCTICHKTLLLILHHALLCYLLY